MLAMQRPPMQPANFQVRFSDFRCITNMCKTWTPQGSRWQSSETSMIVNVQRLPRLPANADAKQGTACEQDFHGLLEFPTAWPERPRFCGLSCFFTLARGSHKESCAAPWDFASSRDASNSYRTASNILTWHVLMSCITMNLAGQFTPVTAVQPRRRTLDSGDSGLAPQTAPGLLDPADGAQAAS